ncbi:hypothetical protein V5799_018336 [Amblyomma americanum]|uniref:Uncharacterized protein n=1 Tax=Amblyomma americanum TaxID=6943 RepID=A0AAQ4F0M6_AMBAM
MPSLLMQLAAAPRVLSSQVPRQLHSLVGVPSAPHSSLCNHTLSAHRVSSQTAKLNGPTFSARSVYPRKIANNGQTTHCLFDRIRCD